MVSSRIASNLPILHVARPDAGPTAQPGRGFWARLSASFGAAAASAGAAIATAYRSVDGDLRQELATLPLMGLSSIGRRHLPVRAKRCDGERPVIFVHGMGGHPGNFRAMRAWFAANGRTRLYSVGLPSGETTDEHANHLARFIEAVLEVNDLPAGLVDLVAHSRGGIVARLALEDVAVGCRVATLVTIGTPHQGTVAARFGRGPYLDELRPGSRLIERLSGQLPWMGPRLVCLWSESDPLVVPAEYARVPGAAEVEIEGLGHCRLLLWPEGWRAAFAALREAA